MQSLKEVYKIGNGPSSSHTMGPAKAVRLFKAEHAEADRFEAILYGSLAMTGKGHLTDCIIKKTFLPFKVDVFFDKQTETPIHPNTLVLRAFKNGELISSKRYFSVGGGDILIDGVHAPEKKEVYSLNSFKTIADYCQEHNLRIWQYAEQAEGVEIWEYLRTIWEHMQSCINAGLSTTGELAGGLKMQRKAKYLYNRRHMDETAQIRENRLVCAYAYAVSEQNASGGIVVTAPTCGSSGVMPAALKYMQMEKGFSDEKILRALATGGIIGNIIKTNASISGAECGCQAEIGSACSMTAAALAELFKMEINQIEYSAEVAMEHHLGLTCDPIDGLVQIPCIERNAVAAMRAIQAFNLSNFLADLRKISFDLVVKTMYETGLHLSKEYKETSIGGLAKNYMKEAT